KSQGDPYYPVPRKENADLYAKYKALADAKSDVHFVGRLATYKYYNMDQIVAQALTTYAKITGMKRLEASAYGRRNGKDHSAVIGNGNGKGNGNGHIPQAEPIDVSVLAQSAANR
ncbi:MAG TPA: UDP-galactopyranose mutase, partial [Pyrinomonadaceae bacterium]|nr:UDP-galactopyranose mutase [Pyrinomonadaceae bacterium]